MYRQEHLARVLHYVLFFIFVVIVLSLFNLQIIHYDKYNLTAENNFLRIKTIYPIRGDIYDSNFQPIVTNKPSYNLYFTPVKITNKDKITQFITGNFKITTKEIEDIIYKSRFRKYQDILILQNVAYEKMLKISEEMNYFPALSFKSEAVRDYKYPNHFTGHLGRINEREYAKLKDKGYSINSFIGKNGIEKYYENNLRGKNGYEIIQVDAKGKNLQFFRHNLDQPSENGADLILTIDNRLQDYINTIFPANTNGAIVVMEPSTGKILAYVSKPDFDLNIFSKHIVQKDWDKLTNDPNKPMLDRIIHGTYPPGSVYKPIIASLALEDSLITRDTKLTKCDGGMQVGRRYFKCWYEDGHGKLNVVDAMKYSCDVFFYDLSREITLDHFREYSIKSKLCTKMGIDLPDERSGFFPTRSWYVDNYTDYVGILGHKVNLAIGQGEVLVTPLQICSYYAALHNKGKWVQPHLLDKIITQKETKKVKIYSEYLPLSDRTAELLEESLFKAVNGAYGTGVAASIAEATVYGKTGSSENHMGKNTHAWFSGYAKCENKSNIAFVIFMENAGHGGSISAPIAKKLIRYYVKL